MEPKGKPFFLKWAALNAMPARLYHFGKRLGARFPVPDEPCPDLLYLR